MAVTEAVDLTAQPKEKHLWLEQVHDWVTTVDHKKIGIMYIVYALVFMLIAGVMAILIRIQLAVPNNHFISPQAFNRLFTMHGTTMVFFVGMPILFGFGNYLVPLMIGARDMAFPRMNAFTFWISAFGGIVLYYSYIGGDGLFGAGTAPDVGWFAYAPLTERVFSPGHSTDYWTLSLLLTGIGTVGTSINLMATMICMRCKGMTMTRMPLLPWLYFVTSFLALVAIGPLTAAQIMLLLDRYVGAHFFDTQAGGSAILWVHFFWIFGHPEVYILVLPAFAFANEIIPVFSRKAIFGYPAMVAATVSIAFISMGVWAHHMFTIGMGPGANTFFTLSTMIIAVPTRHQDLQLAGDSLGRQDSLQVPHAVLPRLPVPVPDRGLTGIMLSAAPFDWQLGNSYFVIAHFHYVLVGAILFCIFAAFYFWYPKAMGRMLSERLAKWHFWLMVIGFHLTFDFMHVPGILGMPRRIYTYEAGRGWRAGT